MADQRRWYHEPLLLFALCGAVIYISASVVPQEKAQVIQVGEAELLDFVQQQSRDFTTEHAARRLANADDAALADLVSQYVREEALYREARALGFAERDYVIRRRLVQRVELLAQGAATTNVKVTEQDVRTFFEQNAQDYEAPERVTFTHVFYADRDAKVAEEILVQLNVGPTPFSEAAQYGERFLYHLNYVERPLTFVQSHFGDAFVDGLAKLAAGTGLWHGPLRSDHGWHLVLLSARIPAHIPQFSEVQDRLTVDLRHREISTRAESIVQKIIAKYSVVNDLASD